MSTIEEIRNQEAHAVGDQNVASLGWGYPEKYRKLIHKITVESFHNFKSNEDAKFMRDLCIVLLAPQSELDQKAVTQIINKFGLLPNELEETIHEYNRRIEKTQNSFTHLIGIRTSILTAGFLVAFNSNCMTTLSKRVDEISDLRNEQNSALIRVADKFQNVTAEEWKNIEAIFEKKQLKFSSDFVRRCQEIAKKAMAA
jgi:hypothetical protein